MTHPTDAAIAQAFREVYADVSEFLPVSEFYSLVLHRADERERAMTANATELASDLHAFIGKMSEGEATSDEIDSAVEGLLPRIHDFLLRLSPASENASDVAMEEGFSDISALMVSTHRNACAEQECGECERKPKASMFCPACGPAGNPDCHICMDK